jgi:hypothetical protein
LNLAAKSARGVTIRHVRTSTLVDFMKGPRKQKRHSEARKITSERPAAPIGLERVFTVDEIAQTGVACRAKLYLDIKAGRLKAKKFGRSTRITESAYREYLESAPAL